jgi:hypothetical protein
MTDDGICGRVEGRGIQVPELVVVDVGRDAIRSCVLSFQKLHLSRSHRTPLASSPLHSGSSSPDTGSSRPTRCSFEPPPSHKSRNLSASALALANTGPPLSPSHLIAFIGLATAMGNDTDGVDEQIE